MQTITPTLQSIFQSYYQQYRHEHGVSFDQYKAAQAIMRCHTNEMGSHDVVCPEGDYVATQHHSCRHRACPRCHDHATHQWLDNIEKRLLPVSHYHAIFTLPHELNPLWQYNREWFQRHFFVLVAEVLNQLLADPRFPGAQPGMLLALHTWGRTLNFHPHIHALITGGGMQGMTWILGSFLNFFFFLAFAFLEYGIYTG